MLTRFRRRLGELKDKLERRAATLGSAPAVYEPISDLDKGLLLDWITGKIDDDALIDHARSRDDKLALMARACAVRSGNPRVWIARAQFCLDEGRSAEAVEYAKRAHILEQAEPEVGLVLLKALIAAGLREEALQLVPGVLFNARRTNKHGLRIEVAGLWRSLEPGSVEPLLEAARTHVAAGDPARAIAEFTKLADEYGPRAEILLPLASVYQDLLQIDQAGRVYQQAVDAEPDNVDALCMAGVCARDLGDASTADRLLTRALALDPGSSFALFNLGMLRLNQGRIDDAAGLMQGARAASRGEPWTAETMAAKLATPVARKSDDVEWANARFKLVHDIEQFQYLRAQGRVGAALDPVIAEYKAVLRDPLLPADAYNMVALDPAKYPLLARSYKAPVHASDPEPAQGPLVNPDLAWKDIEQQYFDAKPNLVVIDDLLTADALAAIRAYCLESTVWNELKGGYLGAYMPDGFSGRLLLRIGSELRSRLPRVIAAHLMHTMWGYKYDSRYAGIGVHADDAAVNVNFWITPDEANLDPESGGLVVYTHNAPRDWSFQRFNSDRTEIYRYLQSVEAKKVRVPYRANRAVIFDSDLFHETDAFRFREGYENRRVNITMLYGARVA
jgi:tetratricopeptide (TPR) repeat protein